MDRMDHPLEGLTAWILSRVNALMASGPSGRVFLFVLLTRNRGRLEWNERIVFHLIPHIKHPLRIRQGGTAPICYSILGRCELSLHLVCHGPRNIRATSIAQHVPPMAVDMVPLLTCGPLFLARHSASPSPALGGHPVRPKRPF